MTDIKQKTIDISIWTLVWIISSIITTVVMWTIVYSNLEKRVSLLEIKQLEKADKDDLKIIELKLENIKLSLEKIEKSLKNNKI